MNEKRFKGLVYTSKGKAHGKCDIILPQSHESDLEPNQEMHNLTSADPDDSSQGMPKQTSSNTIDLLIA